MPMLTGAVDAVIGVDTHRDKHTVAVVDPHRRPRRQHRVGH